MAKPLTPPSRRRLSLTFSDSQGLLRKAGLSRVVSKRGFEARRTSTTCTPGCARVHDDGTDCGSYTQCRYDGLTHPAPRPWYRPISSRLHVYGRSDRPLLRSCTDTCPCIPVSGREPAPHRARGTARSATTLCACGMATSSAVAAATTNLMCALPLFASSPLLFRIAEWPRCRRTDTT